MNWCKNKFILFLVFPLFFGACITSKQPANRIMFYTLEYNLPRITNLEPLSHVIKMERFSVAPTYNTSQIIYRDKSFKRDAYVYHKWRVNPGDMVTHFLNRDIGQSGLFKATLSYESKFPSSYSLEGSVDEFFEWDTENFWKAILSVSITLMAENEPDITKRIIFQKAYHAEKISEQKNPGALTEAMSRAMAEISLEIVKDIYNNLKDRD